MNYVLDTNTVIYHQKGMLAENLPLGQYSLSVISEIELLSFAGLTADQEEALKELLNDVAIVPVGEEVKQEAIRLRRQHRLRVPDAIIAATAVCLNAQLLTNDSKLKDLTDLPARALALRDP